MFIVMETRIHFVATILKFRAKSAPQTTQVFVVSTFVLGLELTMDVV